MPPRKKQDFETRLARLTEIVETLEKEDPPLEKGMNLYKEGVDLVKACRKQLEQARYDVSVFNQEGTALNDEAMPVEEAHSPDAEQEE